MHDSGTREHFGSGAVRDTAEGKPRPDLTSPFAEERRGAWIGKGAKKYSENNWQKGMPQSRFWASLRRHVIAYQQGDRSEDHLAAICFNAEGIMHFEELVKRGKCDPAILDMPTYEGQVPWKPNTQQGKSTIDTVYLDMDGVLANLTDAVLKFHGVTISKWPVGIYSFEEALNMTTEQVWWPIADNPSFWPDIKPYDWNQQLSDAIVSALPGTEILITSRPVASPNCHAGKFMWVQSHVSVDKAKTLVLIQDKSVLAAPSRLLIDDCDENVDAFRAKGGHAILFPQPWNRNAHIDDPIEYVKTELAQYRGLSNDEQG